MPLNFAHIGTRAHTDARGRGAKLSVAKASTRSTWPGIAARRRLGSSVSRWGGRNLLFLPIYGLADHDHGRHGWAKFGSAWQLCVSKKGMRLDLIR